MTIAPEELELFKNSANFDVDRPTSLGACTDYFSACGLLLAHIDAQAARIAELEANAGDLARWHARAVEQRTFRAREADSLAHRNRELDKELAELRAQQPVAYIYQYAGCETCAGFEDWREEISRECPPEWMIETGKVTGLQPLFNDAAPIAVPGERKTQRENWTVGDWVLHVGGRHKDNDPANYVEFGSMVAVAALIKQVAHSAGMVAWNACRAEVLRLNNGSKSAVAPDDFVMLIRQLVRSLKKSSPDHKLVTSVPDYMTRMGYWKVSDCLRTSTPTEPEEPCTK